MKPLTRPGGHPLPAGRGEGRVRGAFAVSKTTSPGFKSGFNPPAKPQVSTSSGELAARNSRTAFSAFFRPMPVMRMETSGPAVTIFRNGAASAFNAKQTSVGIWQFGMEHGRLVRFFAGRPPALLHLIPASLSFQIRYNSTVARTSRRQYSAISRYFPSAISVFTSMPVTPWLLGDSMPKALQ